MENSRIYFSDDVSILEHATFIVFRNFDGLKEAIYIERYEDTEQVFIYEMELFNRPSDSFLTEDDLDGLNSFADTKYTFDGELNETEMYLFVLNMCHYYGAINFDQYPNTMHLGNLENYLKFRELLNED